MKKLLSFILAATMLLSMTVVVGAEDAASEEFTAYIGEVGYTAIEDALDDAEEGDEIKLVTGAYDAFEVDVPGVTITGVTEDTVITANDVTMTAFMGIKADDVTVKGLTFVVPEECEGGEWLASVIGFAESEYNYGGVTPEGWDVIDCTFINEGNNVAFAIFNVDSYTVDGCTFENFDTAVCSMCDGSALGTVEITNNVFTDVNSPANVYWGHAGEGTLTITGNTFDGARDGSVSRIAIHDYATSQGGGTTIGTLVIDDNDYEEKTEFVLTDSNPDTVLDIERSANVINNYSTEDMASAFAPADEVVYIDYGWSTERELIVDDEGDITYTEISTDAGEAFLNGSYYATIDAALDAAETGDTVILATDAEMTESLFMGSRFNGAPESITIDLNGNELTFADKTIVYLSNGDLTLTNGYINIDGYFVERAIYQPLNDYAGHALFAVYFGSNLTFDNVKIIGSGFDTYSGFAYVYGTEEGSVNFIESSVDLAGDRSVMPAFIRAEEVTFGDYTVDIIDSDINLVGTGSGFTLADMTIADSTITMKGNGENFDTAFNRCAAVVDDSIIRISGMEDCGIKLYNDDFEIINGSTVEIKDCGEASVRLGSGSDPDADPVVYVEKGSMLSIESVEDMDLIEADKGVYYDTTPSGKIVFEQNTPEWFMMVLDLKRLAKEKTYTVEISATEGGSASPDGEIEVSEGDDVIVTFTADEGYTVGALLVDGEAVEAVASYTFEDVDDDHTVSVIFEKIAEEVKEWVNPYTDVAETDDIYAAVKYVSENGLFEGTAADMFDPHATMTRAMFATVLWRLSGAPTVDYPMTFEDVVMAEWYGEAVRWAASAKTVLGYSETVFGVDDAITVEQALTVIARHYGFAEADTKSELTLASFGDSGEIADYAIKAVEWAVTNGIYAGKDGKLSPSAPASRAVVASLFLAVSDAYAE